jgi:hypothetical protein
LGVPAPFEEQRRGVAQCAFPALDDRVAQSAQGFGRRQAVGGFAFGEFGEALVGEQLAVGSPRITSPSDPWDASAASQVPGRDLRQTCETTRRSRVVLISNRTPKPPRALGSRANTMTPDRRLGAQSSAQ